ncbi:MAG: plasmid pRiA4b ORF-3 family protein [Candidatus Omnitrophica bacterium]|nr:plasmid pRiA4b ORF-3 family protein [Candidatus Omnitrophota bacterium]
MQKKKFMRVYQFRVTLNEINPLIWRQIHVPESYSFWDLHIAIQDVMPWKDYHLHEFKIVNPKTSNVVRIGIPDEEDLIEETECPLLPGWNLNILDYFSLNNTKADYLYDFGDNWQHTIILEKILPKKDGVKYPVCIAGERACPPEDCGGIGGYFEFLEAINNSYHEQHEEMLTWTGGKFDPEYFEPRKVKFWNPHIRFKIAFGDKKRI